MYGKTKINQQSFIDSIFKRVINLLNLKLISTKTETIYQMKSKPFLKKSFQKCGYISKKYRSIKLERNVIHKFSLYRIFDFTDEEEAKEVLNEQESIFMKSYDDRYGTFLY